MRRKSRFQTTNNGVASPQGIPTTPRRTFKANNTSSENQLLSPPKNLIEPVHQRSNSGTNVSGDEILSPPRNLVESAHRRLITSATCSTEKSTATKPEQIDESAADVGEGNNEELNRFLKEQRMKIDKILNGETNGKAKIVLSGPSNSTSSMVAAICYSWLLENRRRRKKNDKEKGREELVVAPVMNASRRKMWTHRQAAWLFNQVGLDATALLFSDEVDLERLMMGKQLSILIVGEDILKTDRDVASRCTILTDNYCEDSYDLLLQNPILKNLLLAGVVLDTRNLDGSGKLSTTRDAEAVQLLSVGSAPNYRNTLYEQLVQDQRDGSFTEVLQLNYGKPPNGGLSPADKKKIQEKAQKDSNSMKNTSTNNHISSKSANAKPAPTQVAAAKPETSPSNGNRGKNKFFLAKWFGFGSK
ncbi:uncharacterized protein LOC124945580 [Impatiens glandulifera]|uniref:uncharacterized protein LOC124945580 n=1 Tax=Impatiens glandulifera TaxID=253017 RepID=UPI001FB098D8|nr:uncharacterized protein LOC124945580 [Impatiens glandulifera]